MAIVVETQHTPPAPERQRRPAPWSPRAWRQALAVAAGIPAQLAVAVPFAFAVGVIIRPGDWRNDFGPVVAALLATLGAVLFLLPALTAMHRHRLRVTAGVAIAPQPAGRYRWGSPGAVVAAARSQAVWRQACYHFLAAPALAAAAVVAIGTWLAGLSYALVYAYGWGLPGLAAAPRTVRGPEPVPPAADTRAPGRHLADAGRRRVAVRRALAHRGRAVARRQSGWDAARPEPRR